MMSLNKAFQKDSSHIISPSLLFVVLLLVVLVVYDVKKSYDVEDLRKELDTLKLLLVVSSERMMLSNQDRFSAEQPRSSDDIHYHQHHHNHRQDHQGKIQRGNTSLIQVIGDLLSENETDHTLANQNNSWDSIRLSNVSIKEYLNINRSQLENHVRGLTEVDMSEWSNQGTFGPKRIKRTTSALDDSRDQIGGVPQERTTNGIPGQNDQCPNQCTETMRKAIKKSKRDKTSKSAHFTAYVDKDRLSRQPLNDSKRLGSFDGGAFVSKGNTLRFWQPSDWMDKDLYKYKRATGRLRIKESGIYMVYVQVLFHDSAARKSVGLYLDDQVVPIHEAISFDVIRNKRDVEPDENFDRSDRSKRTMKLYSQCNFVGLIHVTKRANVYIKCSEDDRGILPKPYLTYWGITQVSSF